MKVIFSIASAPWKECVVTYGITYHCYRFQGIFDNANGLAVHYTNMKDMGVFITTKAACKYLVLIQ